ncbi:MAG: cysteine-rich small domain-containing protein [Nitrososphaerales archaeon]
MSNIEYFEEVIKYNKIIGPKKDCKYYPCHFDGQDCTWCFCPFYPCQDGITGGVLKIGELSGKLVWGCAKCRWIHRPEVASLILKSLKRIMKKERSLTKNQLLKLREEILKIFPP